MGQLEFDKASFGAVDAGGSGSIKNTALVDTIAGLLDFEDKAYFAKILLNKVNVIRGQENWSGCSYQEATDNTMALAKKIYDNLFNWLVIRMNKTIQPPELEQDPDGFLSNIAKTIGLLDIFGFENFKKNSFEQFCINYVNEKLHKLYIAAIFEAEKQELTLEGLAEVAANIEYPETQVLDILRLMDYDPKSNRYKGIKFPKPPETGIFMMIDDKAIAKNPTKWEDIFLELDNKHKALKKVYYKTPKKREEFSIVHSA